MSGPAFRLALISDVFFDDPDGARLRNRLSEARALGADLAVLPELPLNPWSPATRDRRPEDAEPPGGPRSRRQAEAAAEAGIALVGGAIVIEPATGLRHNTALVFDADGGLLASYRKAHLPREPGFWETSHYEPGDEPPAVIRGLDLALGVQICSDVNRPEGCHVLGAAGAQLIVAPRATERVTWPRWRPVFIANALTSRAFVASVNRPAPEADVRLGGPSIVITPSGEVRLESTAPVEVAEIDAETLENAAVAYPGYLPVRADLYARAWSALSGRAEGIVAPES